MRPSFRAFFYKRGREGRRPLKGLPLRLIPAWFYGDASDSGDGKSDGARGKGIAPVNLRAMGTRRAPQTPQDVLRARPGEGTRLRRVLTWRLVPPLWKT